MARLVNYIVTYGVTSRHLSEGAGVFTLKRDAQLAYDTLVLKENYKAKRLVRLSYPDKWSGADTVTTLCEVVA